MVRRRILLAFENADLEPHPEHRAPLLTFVIVGAGPTGVEMAGQIAEIARDTLPRRLPPDRPHAGADPARGDGRPGAAGVSPRRSRPRRSRRCARSA
jgi:hypothetical protein